MTWRNMGTSSSFRGLFLRPRLSSEGAPLVLMAVRRVMMISGCDFGFSPLRLVSKMCLSVPYHLACQPSGRREAHDHQADAGFLWAPGGCENSQIVNSHHENSKLGHGSVPP